MSEPLVSVVMATHNRHEDVARAARSVLAQEIQDLELVVVDDASTDATPGVLEALALDPRVRIVRNDRSLGECGARNRGLEAARGELIAFCDDDDVWLPGAARCLIEGLAEHPEVGGISSWYQVEQAGTGRTVDFRGPCAFDAERLLWQNFTIVFGMFRRSAFSSEFRFDPGFDTGGDWDFWLCRARERPVLSIPRVLYRYRQHSGGRATGALQRHVRGRRALLTKHGEHMSPACRLYHETVIAGYEDGRAAMGRHLVGAGQVAARDAAFVSWVLVSSFAASRIGVRRGDPGLQARIMASLLGRSPRA